jgi:hypothetical protein
MRTTQLLCKSLIILLTAIVCSTAITPEAHARIEAEKGKKYKLTKRHGPWMIMVASLRDIPESRRSKGSSNCVNGEFPLIPSARKPLFSDSTRWIVSAGKNAAATLPSGP